MGTYAILIYPAANRVYTNSAAALLRAELTVFNHAVLGGAILEMSERTLGSVPYVHFTTSRELSAAEQASISNISSLYALFSVTDDALHPLEVSKLDIFGSDLVTIQKYSGKTNEQFTKLLLNVTALATNRPQEFFTKKLRVLDPMAGRGTTLNQAVTYGFHAAGVDVDKKDFEEYTRFFKTWLKNNRLKHDANTATVRREHRQVGRQLDITFAATKEDYKAGEIIDVRFVNGDTVIADQFFRDATFDCIVTDAPYGVQHGSHGAPGEGGGLSRKPHQLLTDALPAWKRLLRVGGSIGISWNTNVASRKELAELLESAGLEVVDSPGYDGFEHRVDQAIIRDLIVARKN